MFINKTEVVCRFHGKTDVSGCLPTVLFPKPALQAEMAVRDTLMVEKALPMSNCSFKNDKITGKEH